MITRGAGAALLIVCLCTASLRAQTLRVLRVSPSDSGTSGSLITVTFNRPIAGVGAATIAAASVMRIEPPVAGTFEWRDPATVRFVPTDPLAPGTQLTVAVDTAAVASNGVRSARPFTFAVRIPGVRLLRQTIEGTTVEPSGLTVGPLPIFSLLYSGAVAQDSVGSRYRLEFPELCGGVIRMRAIEQRAPRPDELNRLYDVFPYGRDGMGDRFMRVVDLIPTDSLRPGCAGTWTVVSPETAGRADTTRIPVSTYPSFAVSLVRPATANRSLTGDPCDSERLCIRFSTPLSTQTARRVIRTNPPLVLDTAWGFRETQVRSVAFKERLTPQQSYTVTIDSSARDIYGRPITGPRSFTVVGLDRVAGVSQQSALVTVSHTASAPASVTVRVVNVDTLLMHIVPLPDSFIPRVLATTEYQRPGLIGLMAPALRDTLRVMVPVRGSFNREGNVDVPLPPSLIAQRRTTLFALRFEIKAESFRPESAAVFAQLRQRERELDRLRQQVRRVDVLPWDATDLGMIVQVTSLVAQVKITGNTGAIFVTDRRGVPVRGARATLYDGSDSMLSSGVTGPDGLAMLMRNATAPRRTVGTTPRSGSSDAWLRYVVVERGTDKLLLPVNAAVATTFPMNLSYYGLGTRPGGTSLMRATVTTDRDLYRPGEMVSAKAYAAYGMMGARAPIVGDSVRMMLLRGDYYHVNDELISIGGTPDTVGFRRQILNGLGTAVDSIRLPASARPGPYLFAVDVRHGGAWKHMASQRVRVEAFRAPEFRIAMVSDTTTRYVGDTVVARLSGEYLFGMPMSGAKVTWTMWSTSALGAGRPIPNLQGFTVGLAEWWTGGSSEPRLYRTGTDSLDDNGALAIRIPTTEGSVSVPTMLRIMAQVTDLNNQSITVQSRALVQTSSVYVALKDRGVTPYGRPGVAHQVDVLAVRLTGERVVGAPLRVTVVRRRLMPDSNASRGSPPRWIADTVLTRVVSSATAPVPIRFTPATEGAYDVRVETTDERGRVSASNIGRWAGASPFVAPIPWLLKVATQIEPTRRFSLGDTAKVSFVSPFEQADAWITIEREGVLEQQRKTVPRGTTTVNVPVSRRLAPNAFVGVTLVERSGSPRVGVDTTSVPLRAGYTEIRVDSTVNRLRVVVEPPRTSVKPGDTVVVRVRVRNAHLQSGAAVAGSEVALWAVDEGVLSLTGMRTPDIVSVIDRESGVGAIMASSFTLFPWIRPSGEVRAGVNVRRLRDGMALSAVSLAAERAGGVDFAGRGTYESDSSSSSPEQAPPNDLRSNFRLTAFFVGRATANASGVATIRAKLPDNITTFRLMATATGSGGRYGSGEAQLLVARHFVLRPALPRFLRPGDAFSANAILSVRDSLTWPMTVTAAVSNAVLSGDSSQATTVSGTISARVRFPVSVPTASAADITRVTFTAANAQRTDGDAVATVLPIRAAIVPRAHVAIGMLSDTATVTVALPADVDPSRSRFTLSLGTSPLLAMEVHERRLREHTYLTSDYIAATARAGLSLSQARRSLGVRAGSEDSIAALDAAQRAVATLAGRQSLSGDFFYWPVGTVTIPWLTANIGAFLLDAKRAGVTVPDVVIAGAVKAATSLLAERGERQDTVFGTPQERRRALQGILASRLAFAQFLRHAGAPVTAVEDTLLMAAGRMRWEDRVNLVGMLAQRADRRDTALMMLSQLWTAVGRVGKRIDVADSLLGAVAFVSHVRPIARLLQVTMQLEPAHPMLGALRETLVLQAAAERGWAWNVHDHASAIEALATFVQRERQRTPVRIVARSGAGRVLLIRRSSEIASDGMPQPVANDTTGQPLVGVVTQRGDSAFVTLRLNVEPENGGAWQPDGRQFYYAVTVKEIPKTLPVTPDVAGIAVERWYEHFTDGTPVTSVAEGDLVRVRLRVTVPSDRQFVVLEDALPAGLEVVDLTMRTSRVPGPFASNAQSPSRQRDAENARLDQSLVYGSWDSGWWSPWEYKEQYDDRIVYFTRQLWAGAYVTSYLARATTAGTYVRPPAHAAEIYNPAAQGRSEGGLFEVRSPP